MNEPSLFAEALERTDPQARAAFLDQACQGDPALRARLERLLAQHDHAGDFLEPPPRAPQPTVDEPVAERKGLVIGHYKLLEVIGEGGMGSVWMAQQTEPVKRLVALKLIKAGMDSAQVIARFEAERQALALMDHPNIAKVLDGGTTGAGRPYFVMDLVKGVPITRYCDEHHLTPRQRLELFLPVCQAIQHAHQKGIIHRDLKPSNVLVALYDGRPVPKVIDFGVAKATGQPLTEQTLVTGFGNIVGTLEYMSPEQAEINQLDIDTRSDVYSLGVLLYELLTGSPPFTRKELEKAGMLEMLRVIREQEPSKPSTKLSTAEGLPTLAANRGTEPAKLTKLVRGELDWIVMKALEKDRNRRYETANGFAMDVQRYLADEAVQACPPSVGYRVRKFARRNKGPVLAVALILLVLIGGVIGTTWGMMRAERAKGVAEGERDEKDKALNLAETNEKLALKARDAERLALLGEAEQRQRAEENLKLATAVLDEIIVKPARQRLTLYTNDQAKGLAADPGRDKLERELLDKGLAFYEKLAQSNTTDWAARREGANAYANVGFIQRHYRNFANSEKAYRQAIDLMEKLATERPEDFDNHRDVAYAYHWFYLVFLDSGRLALAEKTTRHALALFEKLEADFPQRSSVARPHRAHAYRNLGELVRSAKPKEGEEAYQKSIAIWSELATAYPKDADHRNALAQANLLLAELYRNQKRSAQADTAYQAARAGWEKLVAEFNNPDYRSHLGGTLLRWAMNCKEDGRGKEAEKRFREAAIEFEVLQTTSSRWAPWAIHELGYLHLFLGELLLGLGGREQDSENAYRQSVAYHEKQLAQDPEKRQSQERLTWSYAGLARVFRKTNRPGDASSLDAKRLHLLKKLAVTATQALEMNSIAWNLVADPDPDFQRGPFAVELAKKAVKLEPTQGMYWNTLGTAQYRAGNWQEAIQSLQKASDLYQARNFSYDAFFIAMAHWQLGEKEQARRWYSSALVWMEKYASKNEELIRFRAEAASLLGLPEKLTPEQEQAKSDDVKFYTHVLEADPKAVGVWAARGWVYADRGQWKEAAADFAKAGELNPDNPLHLYRQALVRLERGEVAEYRKLCADMLARFGPETKADAARWIVWTCVLAADAVADGKVLLQLAEKAVTDDPKNYRALNELGAVLYRAGRYQEALKRLTEAKATYRPDDEKVSAIAYNWLFRSMAHQRLGQVEEANKWHDKATRWIEQEVRKSKEPGAANRLPWNRRLTLQLLLREAEELLKQK